MQACSITFRPDMLPGLRRAIDQARQDGAASFTMELDGVSHEFLTRYAELLLEYLTGQFGPVEEGP